MVVYSTTYCSACYWSVRAAVAAAVVTGAVAVAISGK